MWSLIEGKEWLFAPLVVDPKEEGNVTGLGILPGEEGV